MSADLCDPMCGSGTIPIEAALMVADTAPGLLRYSGQSWPCPLRWRDLRLLRVDQVWRDCVAAATVRDRRVELSESPGHRRFIFGSDGHPGALKIARDSAARAGVAGMVDFVNCDVCDSPVSTRQSPRPQTVLTNPPWDMRLDEGAHSWRQLGRFARTLGNSSGQWRLSLCGCVLLL